MLVPNCCGAGPCGACTTRLGLAFDNPCGDRTPITIDPDGEKIAACMDLGEGENVPCATLGGGGGGGILTGNGRIATWSVDDDDGIGIGGLSCVVGDTRT
jgi:hypothetical protein